MRLPLICLMLFVVTLDPPTLSAAVPATQPTVIATTQPVAIPYKLTDTNHILVRLKIDGKGPFNFIVDTGAPMMILRVSAAEKLGLKPNARGFANLKQMEIEGGMVLKNVQCLVDTPYQIEGMNAIGATGVELDGLLGYGVLARFRMQIDLTKDRMIWTPVNFIPPPFLSRHSSDDGPTDKDEDTLESMGGLLKLLGPLMKPAVLEPEYRGVVGLELGESGGVVLVLGVLGDSPGEKAGVLAGDHIVAINHKSVTTIEETQNAMAQLLKGQTVNLVVQRDQALLTLHLICAEGL